MLYGVKGWAFGVGLGLLASLPATAQAPAPVPAPAAGLKVAVVDIPQVLQGYKKRDVLQKEIESRVKSVEVQMEALRSQIKDLEEKLSSELVKNDQGMRDKLEIDLAKLKPDLEIQTRWRNIVNTRESTKAMRELFDDIKVAVDDVAKREGVDLVFQIVPPNPQGKGDVMEEIVRRPLLFFRKETVVELSDKVARQVNENLEKQPKK
jgi:outer membrane protein